MNHPAKGAGIYMGYVRFNFYDVIIIVLSNINYFRNERK